MRSKGLIPNHKKKITGGRKPKNLQVSYEKKLG